MGNRIVKEKENDRRETTEPAKRRVTKVKFMKRRMTEGGNKESQRKKILTWGGAGGERESQRKGER